LFVPIHDRNPLKKIDYQYVTVALIAINALVYVGFQSGLFIDFDEEQAALAFVPVKFMHSAALSSDTGAASASIVAPERWTLLSYMFLHGNFLHLAGNMLFLWVFGDNVEDAMGHVRFIMFYLMCGIFAGLVHALVLPDSEVPLIGASGAVAGVIAAYLMLHPKVKVWVLALWRIPIRLSAAWVLGFWIVLQFFNVIVATEDDVAWWAHIGGLGAGALLILFMRRPGVPLFDKTAGGA
jgi:membrane associated rhomboid family serine protease